MLEINVKKDTNPLGKIEKKQSKGFLNDWWKMQQLEKNKGYKKTKHI